MSVDLVGVAHAGLRLVPHLRPRAVALKLVEVAHAGLLGLDSSSSAPRAVALELVEIAGCPRRPLGS